MSDTLHNSDNHDMSNDLVDASGANARKLSREQIEEAFRNALDDAWKDGSDEDEMAGYEEALLDEGLLEADRKVFTFFGWSGCGKTTFLEKVVSLLADRGLAIGVVKHHGHPSPIDQPGKDSDRYSNAGAEVVAVSSSVEYAIYRRPEEERTLIELVDEIGDECDIVIAEGFREQAINPIEFCRAAHNETPIFDPSLLFAMVTDSEKMRKAAEENGIPVFGLEDFESMADFLCEQIGWEG
ncbi:MAG: molybdopterin-guanine dinucleotide biosynthesis protein B [Coriobacteriales bacterium]|jgi:molybdopterin-guanine dinucleotide biosynthesis protein B